MRTIRIIADEKIPFLRGVFEGIADICYLPGKYIGKENVKNADALIIRTRTLCNETLLQRTPVKFIATATIGYDHIDTEWCEKNGITWTNAPGCNSSSVQQYMISALLHIFTDFRLNPNDLTIGIIGVGNVGKKVANITRNMGMQILLNDPPRQRQENSSVFCDFNEISKQADIITFHVPLSKEGPDNTYHMAGESFFQTLKKSVILFNTSRGPVVSQSALIKAISGKHVKACVLDVWEGEPHINQEILNLSYIGTPHIAGYSTDGKINGTVMSVRAVSKYFRLGLDEWYPDEVPPPQKENLVCNCTGKTEMDILKEIYFQTYDIKQDDLNLRQDISGFELLRENYMIRREPPAYSITLNNNNNPGLPDKLKEMGFKVQTGN